MLRNHKKLFIFLFFFFSIGMPAWFVFASYSQKWLEARLEVLITDLREKGVPLSYSKIDMKVTPFSVQATIHTPHIKNPQNHFEWQGQEVIVSMRPWDRYTLQCRFPGSQKLVVPQYAELPLGVLYLEGTEGSGTLSSKGHLENLIVRINHLSSVLGDQLQPLAFKDLSLTLSNMRDPLNLKVSLSSQLINIDKCLKTKPTEHPFTINFVADLSGFKSQRSFPKSLAEWRDGGGVLEVRLLKIDWPPILAEIEGTLTLDEGMYPLGSFSSRIWGYRKAINDMVELGWIKKKKAIVALFMLDLFASSDEKGEKHLVAPITLQNKRFSLGPAPLFKLKPISEP